MKKKIFGIVLFLFLGNLLSAQLFEPKKFKFGGSVGAGGIHFFGKPSVDVHYWNTTFRFSPGLYYISAGITQKVAYLPAWNRKVRPKDRPIILSANYSVNYLLSDILEKQRDIDRKIFMALIGLRYNTNWVKSVYFEFSVGAMHVNEVIKTIETEELAKRKFWYPMIEIRLGGIIVSHKEKFQVLP